METLISLKQKALDAQAITREEALSLTDAPLSALCDAADEIRAAFCGDAFDVCTIINARNGKCSEDCKYCAQSSFYHTNIETYPLLSTAEISRQAEHDAAGGVLRFSIVTSGRTLSEADVEALSSAFAEIQSRAPRLRLCGSLGLLNGAQLKRLAEGGMKRFHNNLESSRRNFPNVCTTHTTDDKLNSLRAAKEVSMSLCSGGIMGLGETMADRIDMVMEIRALGVCSIPVNLLNPIPGTPYEKNPVLSNDEMCRIVAIFRFLAPNAAIRLAGGRRLLPDMGRRCFQSGANAVITGDMLTTAGYTIESDMRMIRELGYHGALIDG